MITRLLVPLATLGMVVWFLAHLAHLLNSYSEVDGLVELSDLGGRLFLGILGITVVQLGASAAERLR